MRTCRSLLALPALGLASAVALATACENAEVYVYTAQRFDEAAGCLADYSAIETVAGRGASANCNPRCLAWEDALYVSTMCPPLPEGMEEVDREPGSACAAALRAPSCTAPPEAGADGGADDGAVQEAGRTPPLLPDGAPEPRDSGASG